MRAFNRPAVLLAAATIAVAAFLLADGAAHGPNFNPDESRWISRAHYLADLRNPFGPTWDDQYMTRGQPPLGSYAVGLGLLVQGRDLETNPPWDYSIPWEGNIALGHKPVPEDLAAGRRTSAVLVAATALVLVGVAGAFVPVPWAVVAGALFAVHPFTVYIGSIATSDALFGLILALAAWAAIALGRQPTWQRGALLGGLLGLGGATKLSPLVLALGLCAAAVVLLAIAALRRRCLPARETTFARLGLIVAISAAAAFIAVYPYLWPTPVERASILFAFRAEEMAAQASDWPMMAVPTRQEALRRVWVNFTERYSLSNVLAPSPLDGAFLTSARTLEFAIPLVGIAVMASLAVRDGPYAPRTLAVTILGGQAAITVLGMRSEFDRYHVPMALLGAVAGAVALAWFGGFVRAHWTSRPGSPAAAFGRRSIERE